MNPAEHQALPEVAVNFALTWDGRVTTRKHTRADFSSPRDKHRLLEIRASGDAVMAGRGTIAAEQMRMRIPDEALRAARVERGLAPEPLRIVISGSGQLDPRWPIFAQSEGAPVIIFSTLRMPNEVKEALKGCATLHLAPGKINFREVLQTLRSQYNVRRVVCEGGPTLLKSLLQEQLVNELNLTFCPRIFGGLEAPTLTSIPGEFLPQSIELHLEAVETIEGEAFLRYRVKRE